MVAARVQGPFEATIVNVYVTHSQEYNEVIQDLQICIRDLPGPFVFMGDFNAHHEAWGCDKSNAQGNMLWEFCAKNRLDILNDGSSTRLDEARGNFSAIDLTFASPGLAQKICWEVGCDPVNSDHFPIVLRYGEVPALRRARRRWLYKEADWEKFQQEVEKKIPHDAHQSIQRITTNIWRAATKSIPRTSAERKGKAVHWWNDEVKAAIKARRKTLRRLRKLPKNHHAKEVALDDFKAARKVAKKVVIEAKKKSWVEYTESFTTGLDPAVMWGKYNTLSGKRRSRAIRLAADGKPTEDPQAVTNLLANHYAAVSATDNFNEEFKTRKNVAERVEPDFESEEDLPINRNFTMSELARALDGAKGTSCGEDNVGYPMLKYLPAHVKVTLLEAYNDLWRKGELPKEWKHSLVVPIPKVGTDRSKPSGYRPVSLTSCVCKIMERMVNHRLMIYLEANRRLDQRQFAGRKGKGTSPYFAKLANILSRTITRKQHA